MIVADKTDVVKEQARGRWREILQTLAPELSAALDANGRHVLCPLPDHDDNNPSFRIDKPEDGKAICACGAYDGWALLQELNGWTFPQAVTKVAEVLRIETDSTKPPPPVDAIEQLARSKRCPMESLIAYGAEVVNGNVRIPMFGPDREQCSHCDLPANGSGKGYNAKGKPAGVYLPGQFPQLGETWAMVEGPKDAAALHGMGYSACGLSTNNMAAKFAELFRGCHVVIVHDLDAVGLDGAKKTARRLMGIAESVRIARLPGELKESSGDDVRDVQRRLGGAAVGNAIETAELFEVKNPTATISNADIQEGIKPSDGKTTIKVVPLPVNEINSRIRCQTDNWPRSVGGLLFVDNNGKVDYLERSAAFFGWLSGELNKAIPWHRGPGCAGKDEVFAEYKRTAKAYEAAELLPHEPPLPGHYYACNHSADGDGSALAELVDRFNPATPIDRDLIWAAFVTPFWGGGSGERPAILLTSEDGRGVGKTTLAEMIGTLAGGLMTFDSGDRPADMDTRLLSPAALCKRVCLVDNVKSHRLSWADFESRITAPEISGRRMYSGEASRPNTLTWIITINGAALSTDIAQRCVIIKLKKPKHSGSWEDETHKFITANRERLISDILGFLRSERSTLDRYSRWGSWERDVLSRLPEPSEAQAVIAERQSEADVEAEDSCLIEEHFAAELKRYGYDNSESVFIPSVVVCKWLQEATNERMGVQKASRILGQLCDEGRTRFLTKCSRRDLGKRGFAWTVKASDSQATDLEERMKALETQAKQASGYF
jgi:hypothetical protein